MWLKKLLLQRCRNASGLSMGSLLTCSMYCFGLGVDKPNFHQYPAHMQISPRIPGFSQPLPFQGGITVLLEPLQLIAGDTHTMQTKSSHSTFFPVLLLLCSVWKVFQTNTQVQKNIAQEKNASLAQSKEDLFRPHQISRRLILVLVQPGSCSPLPPTFHDPQRTLHCFDAQSPGLG